MGEHDWIFHPLILFILLHYFQFLLHILIYAPRFELVTFATYLCRHQEVDVVGGAACYDWSNPTYGSPERDQAMILEALVLMGRDREAFEQARRVSQSLTAERSFTTQSTAYARLALRDRKSVV